MNLISLNPCFGGIYSLINKPQLLQKEITES